MTSYASLQSYEPPPQSQSPTSLTPMPFESGDPLNLSSAPSSLQTEQQKKHDEDLYPWEQAALD
jgi:hypothetical protein